MFKLRFLYNVCFRNLNKLELLKLSRFSESKVVKVIKCTKKYLLEISPKQYFMNYFSPKNCSQFSGWTTQFFFLIPGYPSHWRKNIDETRRK